MAYQSTKTRMRQGETLAKKIRRLRPDLDIDVIIPIPDTSRIAAQSMAYELNIKFREGLMKNRYIGRTFIMPGRTTARSRCVKSSTRSAGVLGEECHAGR